MNDIAQICEYGGSTYIANKAVNDIAQICECGGSTYIANKAVHAIAHYVSTVEVHTSQTKR